MQDVCIWCSADSRLTKLPSFCSDSLLALPGYAVLCKDTIRVDPI